MRAQLSGHLRKVSSTPPSVQQVHFIGSFCKLSVPKSIVVALRLKLAQPFNPASLIQCDISRVIALTATVYRRWICIYGFLYSKSCAFVKPEIRLAQALSEFEAILADDQKIRLRAYRGQSPPNPTDVMRFTAEIDRDASRNRKSRQCVGTRFTSVLHAIQQFSSVVDVVVGGSQSLIASGICGTVKVSLQVIMILV